MDLDQRLTEVIQRGDYIKSNYNRYACLEQLLGELADEAILHYYGGSELQNQMEQICPNWKFEAQSILINQDHCVFALCDPGVDNQIQFSREEIHDLALVETKINDIIGRQKYFREEKLKLQDDVREAHHKSYINEVAYTLVEKVKNTAAKITTIKKQLKLYNKNHRDEILDKCREILKLVYHKSTEEVYNNYTKKYEPINGFIIKGHKHEDWITLFAHRDFQDENKWRVSEMITGYRINLIEDVDRNNAVLKTIEFLSKFGKRRMLKKINDKVQEDFDHRYSKPN